MTLRRPQSLVKSPVTRCAGGAVDKEVVLRGEGGPSGMLS